MQNLIAINKIIIPKHPVASNVHKALPIPVDYQYFSVINLYSAFFSISELLLLLIIIYMYKETGFITSKMIEGMTEHKAAHTAGSSGQGLASGLNC